MSISFKRFFRGFLEVWEKHIGEKTSDESNFRALDISRVTYTKLKDSDDVDVKSHGSIAILLDQYNFNYEDLYCAFSISKLNQQEKEYILSVWYQTRCGTKYVSQLKGQSLIEKLFGEYKYWNVIYPTFVWGVTGQSDDPLSRATAQLLKDVLVGRSSVHATSDWLLDEKVQKDFEQHSHVISMGNRFSSPFADRLFHRFGLPPFQPLGIFKHKKERWRMRIPASLSDQKEQLIDVKHQVEDIEENNGESPRRANYRDLVLIIRLSWFDKQVDKKLTRILLTGVGSVATNIAAQMVVMPKAGKFSSQLDKKIESGENFIYLAEVVGTVEDRECNERIVTDWSIEKDHGFFALPSTPVRTYKEMINYRPSRVMQLGPNTRLFNFKEVFFGSERPKATLIWAHSFMGSMHIEDKLDLFKWDEFTKVLGKRIKLLRYDVFNYRYVEFQQHDGDQTWEAYGRDMARIVSRIDGPVILGGHSMGCAIALRAALYTYPKDRIKGFVLATPPAGWKNASIEWWEQQAEAVMASKSTLEFANNFRYTKEMEPNWLKNKWPATEEQPGVIELYNANIGLFDKEQLALVFRGTAVSELPSNRLVRKFKGLPALILSLDGDPTHPKKAAEELAVELGTSNHHHSCESESLDDWPTLIRQHVSKVLKGL